MKEDFSLYIKLTREEKDNQENCVWATTCFLSFFFSCFFNYAYQVFLQEIVGDICGTIVKVSDQIGIDTHFLRFLSLALQDSRPTKILLNHEVMLDCSYLVFLLIPSFIIALRFFTAPVYLKYGLRCNALFAPLALPAIFYSYHTDIMLMGIMCLFLNMYAFWGHADPPRENYGNGKYTTMARDY
jgi:hypothetical protein